MTHDRLVTPTVAAVGLIPITGNVIPHEWYKHIKRNGRLQANALIILADIVYWHRPVEVATENGQFIRYERKFYGDKLQANAAYYEQKFDLTREQVREAFRCLKDVGVVSTEVRQEPEKGRFNVPYVSLNPKRLWEITVPAELRDRCPFDWQVKTDEAPPLCDESHRVGDESHRVGDVSHRVGDVSPTNTKNTSKNTTEISDDKGRRRHPAEGGLEALIGMTPEKWLLQQGNGTRAKTLRLSIQQQALADEDGMDFSTMATLAEKLAEIHGSTPLIEAGDETELARMRDMARMLWRMSETYRTPESLQSLYDVWKKQHPTWSLTGRQFSQFAAKQLTHTGEATDDTTGTGSNEYTQLARDKQAAIILELEANSGTDGTGTAAS